MRKCDGVLACSRNDQDWTHCSPAPKHAEQRSPTRSLHSRPCQGFTSKYQDYVRTLVTLMTLVTLGSESRVTFDPYPWSVDLDHLGRVPCISLLHLNWGSLASATEVWNAEWVDTFFAPWGNLCGWSQALQHNGCVRCELVSMLQAQWWHTEAG